MFQLKMSAVKVPHHKNTAACVSKTIDPPEEVLLPLKTSKHRVGSNIPLVQVGDHVYVGQKIAEENGRGTAPMHASVSGTVTSIDADVWTTGGIGEAICIRSDGKMEKDPSLRPPVVTNLDEFQDALRSSGIVGLGGAGYPLWAKLDAIRKGPIETVLINGAECEPFITSDHRTMLERTEDIAKGIEMLRTFIGSKKFIFGVESNKPDAIAHLKERFANVEGVEVKTLESVYPQGAKQVFLYNSTGIIVQKGERLAKYKVIITNVSTLAAMGRFFIDGMPLVERTITLDGSAVNEPANVTVPVGTSIRWVVEHCGGLKCDPAKIIIGGPMMGKTVGSLDAPIVKVTNAVLLFDEKDAVLPEESPCIHCGRCVEACPLNLNPTAFSKAMELDDDDERAAILRKEQVAVCMSCGSCSFVCPAHRPLADTNTKAKGFLKKYDADHSDKEGGGRK